MFEDKTIAFIGSGVMGEAMIRGLLAQKSVLPDQILAADPWGQRREELKDRYNIGVTADNREAAEKGQIVVLSIKPQTFCLKFAAICAARICCFPLLPECPSRSWLMALRTRPWCGPCPIHQRKLARASRSGRLRQK